MHLSSIHVHWFASFKHLKLPISIRILVIIAHIVYDDLHDSNKSQLDFMNNNLLTW